MSSILYHAIAADYVFPNCTAVCVRKQCILHWKTLPILNMDMKVLYCIIKPGCSKIQNAASDHSVNKNYCTLMPSKYSIKMIHICSRYTFLLELVSYFIRRLNWILFTLVSTRFTAPFVLKTKFYAFVWSNQFLLCWNTDEGHSRNGKLLKKVLSVKGKNTISYIL